MVKIFLFAGRLFGNRRCPSRGLSTAITNDRERSAGNRYGPATATTTPNRRKSLRRLPLVGQPFFLAVLGFAFIGGLILNLMPCVLPVLSLKVFSLVRHAGDDPRGAWKQGAAFTAGVVVSFWVLAGLLLALRAFGKDLGWGFQMQSPGFILGMIFSLFFLLSP